MQALNEPIASVAAETPETPVFYAARERNKNINACQRLMEPREDLLLRPYGSPFERELTEVERAERQHADSEMIARHFCKEKKWTKRTRSFSTVGNGGKRQMVARLSARKVA